MPKCKNPQTVNVARRSRCQMRIMARTFSTLYELVALWGRRENVGVEGFSPRAFGMILFEPHESGQRFLVRKIWGAG